MTVHTTVRGRTVTSNGQPQNGGTVTLSPSLPDRLSCLDLAAHGARYSLDHRMPTIRPLIGASLEISGPESRTLRASLGLDREHVAVLVETLQLRQGPVGTPQVKGWERAKRLGYPENVVGVLNVLEAAVEALGGRMAAAAIAEAEEPKKGVLRLPLGSRKIFADLRLAEHGLQIAPAALKALDDSGVDLWQSLVDAAATRAALELRRQGWTTTVVMDREPDGPIRPDPEA